MTFISNTFQSNSSEVSQRERIAFLQACWHRDIVDQLRDSFLSEFSNLSQQTVDLYEVPGAFEIPLKAKQLACTGFCPRRLVAGLVVDAGSNLVSSCASGLGAGAGLSGLPVGAR